MLQAEYKIHMNKVDWCLEHMINVLKNCIKQRYQKIQKKHRSKDICSWRITTKTNTEKAKEVEKKYSGKIYKMGIEGGKKVCQRMRMFTVLSTASNCLAFKWFSCDKWHSQIEKEKKKQNIRESWEEEKKATDKKRATCRCK